MKTEKLQFDETAEVGDRLRAFDFQPCKGRRDRFIEGEVVGKSYDGVYCYMVKVDKDSTHDGGRIGDEILVPFGMTFDFDGRVVNLSKSLAPEDDGVKVDAVNQEIKIGDRVIRSFAWKADENPTDKNFHIGTVESVITRGRSVYYKISGLDRFAPADRVKKLRRSPRSHRPLVLIRHK